MLAIAVRIAITVKEYVRFRQLKGLGVIRCTAASALNTGHLTQKNISQSSTVTVGIGAGSSLFSLKVKYE